MKPDPIVRLRPGKRVLFLTKDPDLVRRQLAGELDLTMAELTVDDLLDDINTDAMTPAWVCFSYKPEDLALDAYAQKLYWIDPSQYGTLFWSDADGARPLVLNTGLGANARGLVVQPAENTIYYVSFDELVSTPFKDGVNAICWPRTGC